MAAHLKLCNLILLLAALSQVTQTYGQQCQIGGPLPDLIGSPAVAAGQYLDKDHPALCDRRLAEVSLCYPTGSTLSQGPLTLILRVWREAEDRLLHMVREITLEVQIFSKLLSDSARICGNVTLDPLDHVELQQGDVLGVRLPLNSDSALLPIVTNTTDGSGLYRDTRDESNFNRPLTESDLEFKGDLSLNIRAKFSNIAPGSGEIENTLNITAMNVSDAQDVRSASSHPSPTPVSSIEPTKTETLLPLPSTELITTKSSEVSSISLSTSITVDPSSSLENLALITPSVGVVSASTSISRSLSSGPYVTSSLPADPNSSTAKPLFTSVMSHRSLSSSLLQLPPPTPTQEPFISTEPGLSFSLTLVEDTPTMSHTTSTGAYSSTEVPISGSFPSASGSVSATETLPSPTPTHAPENTGATFGANVPPLVSLLKTLAATATAIVLPSPAPTHTRVNTRTSLATELSTEVPPSSSTKDLTQSVPSLTHTIGQPLDTLSGVPPSTFSIQEDSKVTTDTVMISPSLTLTHTLGKGISTTLPASMPELSLLSLSTTSVQNAFVSTSASPGTALHMSTASRSHPTLTIYLTRPTFIDRETSVFTTSTMSVVVNTLTQTSLTVIPTPSLLISPTPTPSLTENISLSKTHSVVTFESEGAPFPSPTVTTDSMLRSSDSLAPSSGFLTSSGQRQASSSIPTSSFSNPTMSLYQTGDTRTPSQTSSPLPAIPELPNGNDSELASSLIAVIVAVSVLFATLSGCVMLSCTFIVHCRKISRVEQISRRSIDSIENPSYALKHQEESVSNFPLLIEISSEHDGPTVLNTSLESTIDIHDNAPKNSPLTDHDSSQLSIIATTPATNATPTTREEEVIELDDLTLESHVQTNTSTPPTPRPRRGLERSYTIEVVPVINNKIRAYYGNRHAYDKVTIGPDLLPRSARSTLGRDTQPIARSVHSSLGRDLQPVSGRSTLTREHDYEEPATPQRGGALSLPLPDPTASAGAYEEPVSSRWKRLSMPALDDPALSTRRIAPRRNSSMSELMVGNHIHGRVSRAKPGMILHYAEFSLIQSQNEPTTEGAAGPDLDVDRSATSAPSTQHEYEELPFFPEFDFPPPLHPIPAPIRLLKGGAGGYEVPVKKSPLHAKILPPALLLSRMRQKLDNLSSGGDEGFEDEDVEKLIESESESRDTNSESLKSPGNDTLRSQETACSQDTLCSQDTSNTNEVIANNSSTMDGAYFFPSSNEEELDETLKKLSIEFIPSTSIESKLKKFNEQIQHGVWRKETGGSKLDVTFKTASNSAESVDGEEDSAAAVRLLQEVAMMRQFRHPNIPKLFGVVYENRHPILVSEYFQRGDLRKILVQMGRSAIQSDTPKLLLSYCQQVALGMQYLASKGFVHRDLCARNVFVTNSDTCKVGGFGKSRDLTDINDYIRKGGRIQVRWTAPEAICFRQYSTASDVWSYGCLLYEIWSLGRMPFRDCTNAEVTEKVDSGYRPPPPPGCPRVIYHLMMQCWHPNPFSRPCFRDIINTLLRDEDTILQVPRRDAATHESAGSLGASLKAGVHMYGDLQLSYTRRSPSGGHDYDHIQEEQFMFTFPTSSADLACNVKGKRGEGSRDYDEEDSDSSEDVPGGVSMVPQPSIYSDSVPVVVESSGKSSSSSVLTIHNSRNHFFEL